jgi:protein N-terminal amidase
LQCCVQFSPVHGDVGASIARADALLARLDASCGFDVVVLPECACTGYTFRDAAHVRPLAERCGAGRTHAWCAALAARLQALVVCGYVEEAEDGQLYNSQVAVAPSGTVLACHRKHHLFATDKRWACEGPCWTSVRVASRDGKTVKALLGICMDINPYNFTAPFEAYELARAALLANAGVLLFSSAWCDRNPEDPPDYVPPPIDAESTLSYWAARLRPLAEAPKARFFVCADRVGREGETTFCGCSCVMRLGPGAVGRPRASLLDALGIEEEGKLLQDIDAATDDDEQEAEEPVTREAALQAA